MITTSMGCMKSRGSPRHIKGINCNIKVVGSSSSSSSSVGGGTISKDQLTPINKLDPIFFEKLPKKSAIYRYTRPNNTVVAFNVNTLVDYMLSTGIFEDPETRLPFTDEQLQDIDNVAKACGSKKASVFNAKRNDTQVYIDAKFRRDALESLERCAGDVIANILTIIETQSPDEAQMRLFMIELPTFADYYHQLATADSEYAATCISSWKKFIVGPPNRPHPDRHGLISCVSNFLRAVSTPGMGGGFMIPGYMEPGENNYPEGDY